MNDDMEGGKKNYTRIVRGAVFLHSKELETIG